MSGTNAKAVAIQQRSGVTHTALLDAGDIALVTTAILVDEESARPHTRAPQSA